MHLLLQTTSFSSASLISVYTEIKHRKYTASTSIIKLSTKRKEEKTRTEIHTHQPNIVFIRTSAYCTG